MEPKFVLPSPNFYKNSKEQGKSNLHYLTPCGMTLLPPSKQPPPMYGARGSTVPAKYLKPEQQQPNSTHTSSVISDTPPIYNSPPRPEYCGNCDMGLANSQDMRRHLEQHETCPAENCDFTALASILERHMEAKHITGLYKTVKKVWTPEDIAAWRAERRKKYPTTANVDLAKRAKEQRMKRGERLEASKARFGKPEDRRRTRPEANNKERGKQNNKHRNNVNKTSERKKPQGQLTKDSNEKTLTAEQKNISFEERRKFGGTSQMKDYKHAKEKAKSKVNALSSMLCMYGTDSDEDESTDDQMSDTSPATLPESELSTVTEEPLKDMQPVDNSPPEDSPQDTDTIQCIDAEDGSSDEAPDEVPIERKTDKVPEEGPFEIHVECKPETASDETAPEIRIESNPELAPKPKSENRPTIKRAAPKKRILGLNYKRARMMTKQNTMLSKLLESDIRHERNVLLQCVRYVCEQNFFGIGSHSNSFASSTHPTDSETT